MCQRKEKLLAKCHQSKKRKTVMSKILTICHASNIKFYRNIYAYLHNHEIQKRNISQLNYLHLPFSFKQEVQKNLKIISPEICKHFFMFSNDFGSCFLTPENLRFLCFHSIKQFHSFFMEVFVWKKKTTCYSKKFTNKGRLKY